MRSYTAFTLLAVASSTVLSAPTSPDLNRDLGFTTNSAPGTPDTAAGDMTSFSTLPIHDGDDFDAPFDAKKLDTALKQEGSMPDMSRFKEYEAWLSSQKQVPIDTTSAFPIEAASHKEVVDSEVAKTVEQHPEGIDGVERLGQGLRGSSSNQGYPARPFIALDPRDIVDSLKLMKMEGLGSTTMPTKPQLATGSIKPGLAQRPDLPIHQELPNQPKLPVMEKLPKKADLAGGPEMPIKPVQPKLPSKPELPVMPKPELAGLKKLAPARLRKAKRDLPSIIDKIHMDHIHAEMPNLPSKPKQAAALHRLRRSTLSTGSAHHLRRQQQQQQHTATAAETALEATAAEAVDMDVPRDHQNQLANAAAAASSSSSSSANTRPVRTRKTRQLNVEDVFESNETGSSKRARAATDSDYTDSELASSSFSAPRPKTRARAKRVKQSSSKAEQSSTAAAAASSAVPAAAVAVAATATASASSSSSSTAVPASNKVPSIKKPASKARKAKASFSKPASSSKARASTSTSAPRPPRASTSKVTYAESEDEEDGNESQFDPSDEEEEDDEEVYDSEAEAEEEEDLIAIADDHDAAFDDLPESRTISIPADSNILKAILNQAAAAGIEDASTVISNIRHDKITESSGQRVCLDISQTLWESVAKKALEKYPKEGEAPYVGEPGRQMASYRSRAVILMNWGTLEGAVGEIMTEQNNSFTVRKLRELGLEDPKLISIIDAAIKKYTNKLSGEYPMQNERIEIQALVMFCILHERRARLDLGNQLTLLMGKELERMWEGKLPVGKQGNLAELENELLPFLTELYGDEYERLRNVEVQQETVLLPLPMAGLCLPYTTAVTFEKLVGQDDDKRSITLRCWSMAAIDTDLGLHAVLNIRTAVALFHAIYGTSMPEPLCHIDTEEGYSCLASIRRCAHWAATPGNTADECLKDHPEAFSFMRACLTSPPTRVHLGSVLPALASVDAASITFAAIEFAAAAAGKSLPSVLQECWILQAAQTRLARKNGTLDPAKKKRLDARNAKEKARRAANKASGRYRCGDCGYCAGRQENRDKHVAFVHRGEKPFACTEAGCSRVFSQKVHMQRHVAVKHRGEVAFACTEAGCSKAFRYEQDLKAHIRRNHKGEKGKVCPLPGCGKAFFSTKDLNRHKRTHSEERPFKCDPCGFAAIQKGQLTSHLATEAHRQRLEKGDNPLTGRFVCQPCRYAFEKPSEWQKHCQSQRHKRKTKNLVETEADESTIELPEGQSGAA